jgi:rhodanese-related sulfurtransferase
MAVGLLVALIIVGLIIRSYVRRRGIPQYSPAQVDELRKNRTSSPVLLDVRTAKEYGLGSLPGSVHIPLQELRARTDELKRYGEREIVCYCQSGNRSTSAAYILHKRGFNSANMRGGIAEWNFLHRNDHRSKGKR